MKTRTDPRVGVAVRLPRLNWVFRGFYGRFYQPPPLLTATGPVVQFAQANNTALRRCMASATRSTSLACRSLTRLAAGCGYVQDTGQELSGPFEHRRLEHLLSRDGGRRPGSRLGGGASFAAPVAVMARCTLRTRTRLRSSGATSTGGLVCAPSGDPACDAGLRTRPWTMTSATPLNVGFNARCRMRITASTNVMYGSGFANG